MLATVLPPDSTPSHCMEATLDMVDFDSNKYLSFLGYGGLNGKKWKDNKYELERITSKEGKAMNQWLVVVPHTANSTVLNKEEFRDQ
eukprot:863930-Ditylum_brightwellii.AAC.1